MGIDTLLSDGVNVKNLASPETKTADEFPWTEVPRSIWRKAEQELESSPNMFLYSTHARIMKLLNPAWNPPAEKLEELKDYCREETIIFSEIEQGLAFSAWVFKPDFMSELLKRPFAKNQWEELMRDFEFEFSPENESSVFGTILRLAHAKMIFPGFDIPSHILDLAHQRVIDHRDAEYDTVMNYETILSLSNFTQFAFAQKLLYPDDPPFIVPPEGWKRIKYLLENRNKETTSIYDYFNLKMFLADKLDYTDEGLRLVMPERHTSIQPESEQPMPKFKKF